jgi:hypothetical protein
LAGTVIQDHGLSRTPEVPLIEGTGLSGNDGELHRGKRMNQRTAELRFSAGKFAERSADGLASGGVSHFSAKVKRQTLFAWLRKAGTKGTERGA